MRYQIASDLHIEYLDNPKASDFITKVADILVLAGDIGSLYKIEQLEQFLLELSDFEKILYIPGNHEFYINRDYEPRTFNTLLKTLYNLESTVQNLVVLHCGSYIIDNIKFVGCTLWSDLQNYFFPKYRVRIHGFNNIVYDQQFKKNVRFLEKELSKRETEKTVVITHYPPLNYLNQFNFDKKFNYLYYNSLSHLFQTYKINYWHFGHIHRNLMYSHISGANISTNQKGRRKDNVTDFKTDFVIDTNN